MNRITTTTRALRPGAIAPAQTRGAQLAAQGYTCTFCEVFELAFTVTKPGTQTTERAEYKGWLPGGLTDFPEGKCSCEAFNQNGVCKHIYFAIEEKHDTERYAERAEYAAWAAACVGAGKWDLTGAPTIYQEACIQDAIDAAPVAPVAAWPVCNICGNEYAAWDENTPDTSCAYCEKRIWCR